MMRALRLRVYKLFAVVLLTLCIGAQVLEATGRWDRSLQDAGDEAVIVAIVLCIGAAIAVAREICKRVSLRAVRSLVVLVCTTQRPPTSLKLPLALCAHPPLSLRI